MFPNNPDTVVINGVTVSARTIIYLLNVLTNPNPRLWYRFERRDDLVVVETKIEPQV
jgi:hypothetical protein